MGFFDFLSPKKPLSQPPSSSLVPKDIYDASVLELKDIIAPSALKIG